MACNMVIESCPREQYTFVLPLPCVGFFLKNKDVLCNEIGEVAYIVLEEMLCSLYEG